MFWLYSNGVYESFPFFFIFVEKKVLLLLLLLFWEFFSPALADGFSFEFEREQVTSNRQDSSQYFSWS